MISRKMVYLKTLKATLIKKVFANPIYLYDNKYYVGLETLINPYEEIEHCVEFPSLLAAEEFVHTLPQV